MIPRLLFAALAAALALAGAAHAQTGAVKTQAALAAEMQYCVSQGKGPGCITAQQIEDLIVSGVPGVGAGLTAAGSSQGTCLPLTNQINQFTSVAASTGACLPAAVAGQQSIDCNAGANPLSLYPASGAAIGSGGTNNPVSIPAGQCYGFSAISTSLWEEWSSSGGGGGSGTVTSVGLSAPSWLTVGGSPVTSSGTLALSGTSQSANQVLAAPNGSSGAPGFRALVAADIPSLSSLNGSILSGQCPAGTTGAIGCLEVGGGLSVAAGVVQLGTLTPPAHEWFSSVSSAGVLTPTQPGYADLSGAPASGDLILSGGSLGAVSGLAPSTNGDCAVVTTGAWALGSCGSGGGTPTLFVGTLGGSANAYTISTTPSSGWSLTAGYSVRALVPASLTSTGASTLAVDGGSALPIVINNQAGLAALVGGEVQSGLVVDLTYSASSATACASSCYILTFLPGSTVAAGTTQTVSAAQWVSFTGFAVTTSGQTLTLPASSGLSGNGGIVVMTIGQSAILAPNAADAINGGTAGASVTVPAGLSAIVVKSSAGNISVAPLVAGVTAGGTGLTTSTSGGVLGSTAAGTLAWSGALTANLPVIGGGAGALPTVGTRSGNTTDYASVNGALTSGDCLQADANGNVQTTGAACGSGGGGGISALGDYKVGNWYSFIGPGHTGVSGGAQSANTVVCEGMQVLEKATVSTLGVFISTADSTGNIQIAIYTSASGRPATLVGNTASISENVGSATAVSGAISQGNEQLSPGLYWLCVNQDNSVGGWAYITASVTEPLVGSATESDVLNDNYTTYNAISGSLTFSSWTSLASESWSNFLYAPIAGAKVYSVP